jgi:hypothetical protein
MSVQLKKLSQCFHSSLNVSLCLQMQNSCQEHSIVFRSQWAQTVASIKAIGSDRGSVLSKMSDFQIDTLTFCLRKFAKEHHQKILSFAIDLFESLGFKRTAEYLHVVQFVVNYVEQVVADMEKRYQEDLQSAQSSQGQNFNREHFDDEYHVQGKRMESFIKNVLCNLNTYELMSRLKEAYLHMFPQEENPSDIKGDAEDGSLVTESNSHTSPCNKSYSSSDNITDPSPDSNLDGQGEDVRTDASSVTEVCSIDDTKGADVLYKKQRDFNEYGDLSDNEIYMIVQEVTGLYLFEGNSSLYRHDETTYVSITDPHIIPLTVIISSNKHDHTVTAGLIV